MVLRTPTVATALFAALLLAGCGGSSGRQAVSGTVTYDGKPVEYGTITFAPDTSKGATGPQGSAEIRKGKYETSGEKGPVTGPQVVRITGWNGSPETGVLGAPVVSDYTVNVDVSPEKGQLDFDIPAKPAGTKK